MKFETSFFYYTFNAFYFQYNFVQWIISKFLYYFKLNNIFSYEITFNTNRKFLSTLSKVL